MKPRVLFGYRFGVLGGVATQLLNRYPHFSERFDIRFLFEQDLGVAEQFPDRTAIALPNGGSRVDYMREFDPDLTVIIDAPAMITDWQNAGQQGIAVLEVHTTTTNFSYLDQLDVNSGLSGVVTVSEYMRRKVRETAIGSVLPVAIVGNCLDDHWFEPLEQNARRRIGTRPVIWVGKLDGHKRVLAALELLDRIVQELDDEVEVVPVLVGGYSAGTDRVRHVLRTVINRSKLRQRTEWLPRVEYERMPALLRSAAAAGGICLSTSRDESFGMSVAESLASGLRVVAPAVGALPEIVPAEMLYTDGDFNEACSLASALLRDPRLYQSAAANAAIELRSRMTPRSTLRQFEEALQLFGVEIRTA